MAGMKKPNDHAEPKKKLNAKKQKQTNLKTLDISTDNTQPTLNLPLMKTTSI